MLKRVTALVGLAVAVLLCLPSHAVAASVVDITAADNATVHDCAAIDACLSHTLLCISVDGNENCVIHCRSIDSCLGATIVVATTGGLQLYCEGISSCQNVKVYWVNSGNLQAYLDQNDNVQIGGALSVVQCNEIDSCQNIVIYGATQELGLDTVTDWICRGATACNNAFVTYKGSLFVECTGFESCNNFNLTCLSGANCETADATWINADNARMDCVADVNSCICGDSWTCTGTKTVATTEEPLTSTEITSTELTTTVWTSTEQSTSDMPATTKTETSTDNPTNTEVTTTEQSSTDIPTTADSTNTDEMTTDFTTTEEVTTKESMTSTAAHSTMNPTNDAETSTVDPSFESETSTETTVRNDSGKQGGDSKRAILIGVAIGGTLLLVTCVVCGCIWRRSKGGTKATVEEAVSGRRHLGDSHKVEMERVLRRAEKGKWVVARESRAEGVSDGSGVQATDGRDDKQQLDAALRKVGKFQRDEKDARFGQMLGDLNLGNAILQEDVVEDMAVVGETLGYDESQSEARAEGVAVGGFHETQGRDDSEERREAKDALRRVDKVQRDARDVASDIRSVP